MDLPPYDPRYVDVFDLRTERGRKGQDYMLRYLDAKKRYYEDHPDERWLDDDYIEQITREAQAQADMEKYGIGRRRPPPPKSIFDKLNDFLRNIAP